LEVTRLFHVYTLFAVARGALTGGDGGVVVGCIVEEDLGLFLCELEPLAECFPGGENKYTKYSQCPPLPINTLWKLELPLASDAAALHLITIIIISPLSHACNNGLPCREACFGPCKSRIFRISFYKCKSFAVPSVSTPIA